MNKIALLAIIKGMRCDAELLKCELFSSPTPSVFALTDAICEMIEELEKRVERDHQ